MNPPANKETRLQVRVTEAEKAKLQAAADATGLTLSGWLRMIALEAAKKGMRK